MTTTTATFNDILVFRQWGQTVGAVLKSEVIGIAIATDNEFVIYIWLKNGSKLEHLPDNDDAICDELERLISDMGWS